MALRRIIIAHFDCFFFHADVIVMAAKAGPEDFFGIESEYPVDGQPQFVTAFGTIRYDPPAPEAPKWVRKGKPAAPAAPKWEKKEKSQIFSRPQKKREAEEFGENFADFIGERFDAEIPAEIPAGGLVEDQKKFIDSFLREGEIPDPSAPKNAAELAEKIREKSEREELQEIAERDKDGSLQVR